MTSFIPRLTFLCILLVLGGRAASHEFWISPQNFVLNSDAQVVADLRVGENFSGSAYSFNPMRFARFDLIQNGEIIEVEGRLGDRPALNARVSGDGLVIVVHETVDSKLTYKSWDKFKKFVAHKAFSTVLENHDARGLPREGFVESYRRYVKSLIAVGTGAGADQKVGLKTEIIALDNPYGPTDGRMRVKVLLDGAPRVAAQVELFERAPDGTIKVTLHSTDAAGVAVLAIQPNHAYLADAVAMLALDNDDPALGAVWASHWAGLSFAVPERPLN